MADLIGMGEREFFAQFARRTGLFVGRPTFARVAAFLTGYEVAARRHGGAGLDGWREWLTANHGAPPNLVWEAQIRQIAVPDRTGGPELTPEQEARALEVLFELLDDFLAERERGC